MRSGGGEAEPGAGWFARATEEVSESVRGVWKFAGFVSVMYCLNEYVCDLTTTSGPSMLPTLNTTGDIVLMDRISPRLGLVHVGDVVIARSMKSPSETVCKRVAAVEGARAARPEEGHLRSDRSLDSCA